MVDFPRWNANARIDILDEDSILILEERRHAIYGGRVFPLLTPLLDGTRSLTEIVDTLEARGSNAPEIYYALKVLEQGGLVFEGGGRDSRATTAFWHSLGVTPGQAHTRLASASVRLRSTPGAVAEPLLQALSHAQLRVVDEGEAALTVVAVVDALDEGLDGLNQEALATGKPWMLVRLNGTRPLLGPMFVPGRTGCWECLAHRLRNNRQVERYLATHVDPSAIRTPAFAAHPSYVAMGAAWVAAELTKVLVLGKSEALEGRIIAFDTLSARTEEHILVRRPQCPRCGNPELRRDQSPRLVLTPRRTSFREDGGHRAFTPEQTFERFRHHVSPLTGVVTELEAFERLHGNDLTHSYRAGHNFAMFGKNIKYLLKNIRGRSGGKGMTDIQARVSAICEAIERYSGVYQGDEPQQLARWKDLGPEALHPHSLMLYSQQQYENRRQWNHQHQDSPYHQVPEPFDESRKIHWTPAWSLTHEAVRYVPSAYCYFGHPDLAEHFFCSCDGNGNAAGNTLEEAILQGFMELVERDAVALWWYNRVRRPGVDLASFDEPYFKALVSFYARIGREVWVLDITSDLGIPTFAAVCRRVDRPVEDIVLGFGAHFDPRIALMRALTEVNQFMPAVSETDAVGNTRYYFPDPEAISWWKTATVHNQPYLTPAPGALKRRTDYEDVSSEDLAENVRTCVRRAQQAGLEVIVLDQTQPDIGLHVAKVMVPGLRHFWKRFGEGRLYTVPVSQGWLERPRLESELNPTGIFF